MMQEIKKFVVVSMARSGTNALIAALRQHPNCYTDTELFHDKLIPRPHTARMSLAERDADPLAFLHAVIAEAFERKPVITHYGFKIFFGQNDALLESLIKDPCWQVVLLRRENSLDQFLSLKIALNTQVWNSREGDAAVKIHVDEQEFLDFKNEAEGLFNACVVWLEKVDQAYHNLDYSKVSAGDYGALCEFLGLAEPHDLVPKVKKQNPTRSADKVENPQVVQAMLSREGLSHLWVD